LKERYQKYVGIDHSSELISEATKLHSSPAVTFEVADISEFDTDIQFDCAFLIGALHHLESPIHVLRWVSRMVSHGGYVLANEPHPRNPLISLARSVWKKIDDNYSSDQVEFTASQLETMFRDAGLVHIKVIPRGFISTPFAEIAMPLQPIMTLISSIACRINLFIEGLPGVSKWGRCLSWNFAVSGKVP